MPPATLEVEGVPYVLIRKDDYDRLALLAKAAESPSLPTPDAKGNVPAIEYARASLARKIIRCRAEAGWNRRELAKRAGIRVETLCRIEGGKHTPSVATIDRINRAFESKKKR